MFLFVFIFPPVSQTRQSMTIIYNVTCDSRPKSIISCLEKSMGIPPTKGHFAELP